MRRQTRLGVSNRCSGRRLVSDRVPSVVPLSRIVGALRLFVALLPRVVDAFLPPSVASPLFQIDDAVGYSSSILSTFLKCAKSGRNWSLCCTTNRVVASLDSSG